MSAHGGVILVGVTDPRRGRPQIVGLGEDEADVREFLSSENVVNWLSDYFENPPEAWVRPVGFDGGEREVRVIVVPPVRSFSLPRSKREARVDKTTVFGVGQTFVRREGRTEPARGSDHVEVWIRALWRHGRRAGVVLVAGVAAVAAAFLGVRAIVGGDGGGSPSTQGTPVREGPFLTVNQGVREAAASSFQEGPLEIKQGADIEIEIRAGNVGDARTTAVVIRAALPAEFRIVPGSCQMIVGTKPVQECAENIMDSDNIVQGGLKFDFAVPGSTVYVKFVVRTDRAGPASYGVVRAFLSSDQTPVIEDSETIKVAGSPNPTEPYMTIEQQVRNENISEHLDTNAAQPDEELNYVIYVTNDGSVAASDLRVRVFPPPESSAEYLPDTCQMKTSIDPTLRDCPDSSRSALDAGVPLGRIPAGGSASVYYSVKVLRPPNTCVGAFFIATAEQRTRNAGPSYSEVRTSVIC